MFGVKNKTLLAAEFPKINIIPITEINSSPEFSNFVTLFSVMLCKM